MSRLLHLKENIKNNSICENDDPDPFNILSLLGKKPEAKEAQEEGDDKDLDNNLCECKEYFRNEMFSNKCSKCYELTHPNIWLELNNMANFKVKMANQKYSINYLQNYTKMRQIPDKHSLFEVLRHMYLDGSIIKDHNLLNWLNYVKNKTDYKGITTEQAIELINTYNNSPNNYVTDKNRYKIQHSIFGLVIDWWNLYYKNIGGVSCYYSDEGKLPFLNTKIRPAPAFSNDERRNNFWVKNLN